MAEKMNHISILYSAFRPNTAPIQRLLCLLKGLDECGQNVTVDFLYPDSHRSKVPVQYKNVKVNYLWGDKDCTANIVKYVKSFFTLRRYVRSLPEGDTVLLIGGQKYLHLFTRRGDIRVWHERSEHPIVIDPLPKSLRPRYFQACRQCEGILCVTSQARKVFTDEIGVDPQKVHIVNMTVDVSRFEGLEKTDFTRRISYCGTASNTKDGVDELLKAFALVCAEEKDVQLQIIGRTPSSKERSGNLQLIDSLGIKDRVVFTGVQPSEKMPSLLKNSSVLALARPDGLQARCGFPTKLGEYLLTGNPVVVTAVGDIPCFLKDGESALLCQPADARAFADKILWALRNPSEAASIGSKGREVALESFDALSQARIIADLLSEKDTLK